MTTVEELYNALTTQEVGGLLSSYLLLRLSIYSLLRIIMVKGSLGRQLDQESRLEED